MYTAQDWIDPRTIDYTDSLNPLARPRWFAHRNPYIWQTMQDPIWQAIRHGKNMEPRLWVAPVSENRVIGGQLTHEEAVPADPGTWLYAISGSGDQAEGFLVQVTDSETGATLFNQPVNIQNLTAAAGDRANGVPYFLTTPMAFVPPAFPLVRIINLSANPQSCQVVLFTALQLDL